MDKVILEKEKFERLVIIDFLQQTKNSNYFNEWFSRGDFSPATFKDTFQKIIEELKREL